MLGITCKCYMIAPLAYENLMHLLAATFQHIYVGSRVHCEINADAWSAAQR
jgi:hypothetical protein